MNYIQIKQVGGLQEDLNTLSDSIYQTGQYLLNVNEGSQIFEGEKTFEDEVVFNTGVKVYGPISGAAVAFTETESYVAGSFGINQENPAYNLEVRSEAANETASFLLAEGGGDTGGIEITTNTPSTYRTTITHDDTGLVFNTSSIRPYCFMDADVGIGTDTPATKLDVREENVGATTQIRVYNEDNSNTTTQTASLFLGPDSRGNGALIWAEKEHADFSANPERDVSIVFSPVLNNSQTEAMRITSDGNVGIGTTTSPSAPLEVSSTEGGVIVPRMTTAERNAIAAPTNGEIIYNSTTHKFQGRADGSWEDLH
tara:strand:- start:414 stop:1352 length:939 start_codon:yes stop_codon:yes gene_type:complete